MTNIPSWLQDTLDNKTAKAAVKPQKNVESTQVSLEEKRSLSVSQINQQIKSRLEQDFSEVWVKGEISNFTAHRSGHYYFSLKDANSQISAVMFRGFNSKLKFQVENGMEVIVKAKISLYEPRGTYQLMCQHMEPVGAGAMQKAFEQLKAKLSKEGLFDKSHKKILPRFPKKIALITSPTGAAIKDILNVISRRAPGIEILLIPAQVQGERAEASLLKAMDQLALLNDIDAVIIGRGGGSSEDLWCFNSEALARKIYECSQPIVSAVGHEIDFTISDFVADLRAPTPSAAAELIAQNTNEVKSNLLLLNRRLQNSFQKYLVYSKEKLVLISKRLVSPQKYVEQKILRLDDLEQRLLSRTQQALKTARKDVQHLMQRLPKPDKAIEHFREQVRKYKKEIWYLQKTKNQNLRQKLHHQMQVMDSLSPLKVLDRGYNIAFKEGQVVKTASVLKVKDKIDLKFKDKKITAEILKV